MSETEIPTPEVEVGRLAQRLYEGYFSHHVALQVAADPRAIELAPARKPGDLVPEGRVGKEISYHFTHYLEMMRDPDVQREYDRSWLGGALLTLGDALARNGHFDRGPELELVRHLRNAVAHGGSFDIRRPERLREYPAYLRARIPAQTRTHDITADLHGTLLWDFIDAAGILTLFPAVDRYLQHPEMR